MKPYSVLAVMGLRFDAGGFKVQAFTLLPRVHAVSSVGTGDFCTEHKAAEARNDYWPSSIAEIKYECIYSSTSPYKFRACTEITLNYYFVYTNSLLVFFFQNTTDFA